MIFGKCVECLISTEYSLVNNILSLCITF